MITDDYKEFFEEMYTGFTNALFAGEPIPTMYMVVVDKKALVIPPPLPGMEQDDYAQLVSDFARIKEAQYIAHIVMAVSIELPKGEKLPADIDINNIPNGTETMLLTIGDPNGKMHAIYGDVKRAVDGSPYIEEWNWTDSVEEEVGVVILPFTD